MIEYNGCKAVTIIQKMLKLLLWVAVLYVFVFCGKLVCVGAATSAAQGVWTPTAQLALKRCIMGEADGHMGDRSPIAYVLQRRQRALGWQMSRVIYKFCHCLHGRTLRSIVMLSMPTLIPSPYASRWKDLNAWVPRFIAGDIADPCDRPATYWGGAMDVPSPLLERVDCGDTRNIFYKRRAR